MDHETINAIVNNLSDKIGVAASKIAPIGETLIWETRLNGLVGVGAGLLIIIATARLGSMVGSQFQDDPDAGTITKALIWFVGAFTGVCVILAHLSSATMPTCGVLKLLIP